MKPIVGVVINWIGWSPLISLILLLCKFFLMNLFMGL